MFLGHFAVGFGAKAFAPRASLGTLFCAAQLVDLIWPTLLLLGVERVKIAPGITRVTPLDFEHYPVSHSLLAVFVWALGFALLYQLLRRYRRGALVVGAAVVSHWLLDAIVHRPDLPLLPGGTDYVGLGLWNSVVATIVIEMGLFAGGIGLYLRTTRATDRVGIWALRGLVGFLALVYAGNLLGEPPPSAAAIAWVGQAQWLLVAWAYFVDRHRADTRAS